MHAIESEAGKPVVSEVVAWHDKSPFILMRTPATGKAIAWLVHSLWGLRFRHEVASQIMSS
jgi:hypothetical protein